MSLLFKYFYLYSKEFVTYEIDKAVRNEILHSFNHVARNKHRKVFRVIQLVVLMKILAVLQLLCLFKLPL